MCSQRNRVLKIASKVGKRFRRGEVERNQTIAEAYIRKVSTRGCLGSRGFEIKARQASRLRRGEVKATGETALDKQIQGKRPMFEFASDDSKFVCFVRSVKRQTRPIANQRLSFNGCHL
jgi:hypothetical protein